eukprot:221968_1
MAVLVAEDSDAYEDMYYQDIDLGVKHKSAITYGISDAKYQIRVMLLGESMVGKTSMILRYTTNDFKINQDRTLCLDTKERVVSVNGNIVQYIIMDTAGHDGYETMHRTWGKETNGVFFVYDITNPDTLDRIAKHWKTEYDATEPNENAIIFLIGAKSDKKHERKVSEKSAKQFAKEHKMRKYYEVSSLTGHGVDSLFQTMAGYILKYHEQDVIKREDVIGRFKLRAPSCTDSENDCTCMLL